MSGSKMKLPATIVVEHLELHAFHGYYVHESSFGQHFAIDLELSVDIAKSAVSDQLTDALNYGLVIASTRRLFVEKRHKLLEAAAFALGQGLLQEFAAIDAIRIRVKKLAPPVPEKLAYAGVDVHMTREHLALAVESAAKDA